MFLFFLSHVLSFLIPITPRNRERYWKTFAALLMAWNFIPKASQPVCWLLFWLSSIQKTWHNNPWQLRFIWWTTMTDTVMFLRLGIGRSKWISYFLSFFYSPEVITLKISHYIILGCLYFFFSTWFPTCSINERHSTSTRCNHIGCRVRHKTSSSTIELSTLRWWAYCVSKE